jgi:acyl-CoA reductase-like NAD-dependent aldehyde dehydrogenase
MDWFDVRNPRTGESDYRFQAPSAAELDAECARLRSAQAAWAQAPISHRVAVMSRWADAIEDRADQITAALSVDTGRWRMSAEAPRNVANGIRGWCARAEPLLKPREGRSSLADTVEFRTSMQPYPLLAVISPWNFPFLLATVDAIPALLAGCAAIIKPSEITPRFVEPVKQSVAAVPELAKVLAFVRGGAATGQRMIEHADIVVFTGSIPTGRQVLRAAAERFIPSFLELGGKDPAVVTECADLERAATAVIRGAAFASGQICYSIERVYVHESVHDRFVELLEAGVEDLGINYPDIRSGHVGPLILARQAETIAAHLADAKAKGARIRTGGEIEEHGGGLWVRPTILTGVNHEMLVMTEETFGPLIPVMPYPTDDDAVALANDSQYGLSAAVLAGSPERAAEIGGQLNAGAVSLMDTTLTNTILRDAEKNSFGFSGLGGSRVGPVAIHRFVRKRTLITNHGPVKSLHDLGEERPPATMY